MRNQSMFAVVLAIVLGFVIFFYSKKEKPVVKVERTFDMSIDKAWSLWNDPASIQKWWGPKFFTAPTIKNEFHEGGTFLFAMQSPEGQTSWNVGRYLEIIPNKKIKSKMSFSDDKGTPVPAAYYKLPGVWPEEIEVIVSFEDLNGKTKITVREIGIPPEITEMARMGWEQQFDKFAELGR